MNTRNSKVFETALENAKRSAGIWPTQYCEDIDTSSMADFDRATIERIKELMRQARREDQFLIPSLESFSADHRRIARQKLDAGQVAAVDGTNALDQIILMNTSAYAVAVGYITSQTRGEPHITVTATNTQYIERGDVGRISHDDLKHLCQELDEARIDQSWPTTFREYQEREVAMSCGAEIVLIDGPVWTQNLVSQPSGRELYRRMDQSSSSYIGVIKNIGGSWTMSKWCGYALEPGEGFVVGRVKTQLDERFCDHREVRNWVQQMPDDYVRVVFRPNQKAFALECRLSQLPLSIALLLEDASETINHEMPQLLELIDAQIRAGFHASNAAGLVISKIQRDHYRMGIDITNERDYR